jgi:carotenoid cleavage dioxygenase
VLVIAKADFQRQRLLEMPATMMFHFGNAWDEGDEIHLDYVRSPPMTEFNQGAGQLMRGERPQEPPSTPCLLHLNLASGRLRQDSRDEAVEFPVVDPRVVAQRHRQVFYTHGADAGARWGADALMRLDLDSGRRERFVFGADVVVEEHVLVPKPGSRREGEGWLLGTGYDLRRRQSFASVFDAEALSAGPLARVWLPYWVPYGFHSKFYPL